MIDTPAPDRPAPALADATAGAALADFVRAHPRLFVLTGAGCSTGSGIPDYRDEQGAWKRRPPVTYQAFTRDEATRRRYWARSLIGWPVIGGASPNASHRALARLETAGRIGHLVTQNVDGLHGAAGSRALIELHGRIGAIVCLGCGATGTRADFQHRLAAANPGWTGYVAATAPDGDADLDGLDFSGFQVPDCERCGGLIKPDVVFFGENVPRPRVDAAFAALAEADAMLIVGSSLMVYSGYRFALAAADAGRPVAAINRGRTRADDLLRLKIDQDCGEALAGLLAALAL